jgi:hypothetical protein
LVEEDDDVWTVPDVKSRTDPRGSQSAASTAEERTYSTTVPEYRAMNALVDGNSTNRRRRRDKDNSMKFASRDRRLVHLQSIEAEDPIISEGSEQRSPRQRPAHNKHPSEKHHVEDSADLQIIRLPRRQSYGSQGSKASHLELFRTRKRDIPDEVDELGDDTWRSPKRTARNQSFSSPEERPHRSKSISQRGDMKPVEFKRPAPNPILRQGLPLQSALWPPQHLLDLKDTHVDGFEPDPTFVLRPALDGSNKLLAYSLDDDGEHLPWLEVDPARLSVVGHNPSSSIIRLMHPARLDKELGPHLMLKFFEAADARHCVDWIRRNWTSTSKTITEHAR